VTDRDDSPPESWSAAPADVLEAAPYAVITADHAGRVLHCDPAAEQLFGYPPHEAVGQDLAKLIAPPERRGAQDRDLRGSLASGPGPALVRRLRVLACRADGTEFPAEVILLRLPADGRPAFAAYVHDLTERARAEAALRQSEERYRDLVENASDIIYAHDLAGNLTCWNRAGERILGYAVEEALGMNIAQLVAPEHLERARQMTSRKVAEGGRTAYELDVFAKDGRRVTVEINSRLADRPGQAPQVQGMARDVTDRKRLEEAARLSERRYRTLADAVPGIVFSSEPDGSCDYCNQRWYDYTGLAEEQTLGYGCRSAIHPEDWGRVETRWEEAARAGEPFVCQYRLRNAHGGYRWFLGRSVPLKDECGRVVKWFGISTDIDDQKRLEAAMQEADRQKDEFLAMLAHELRNPLVPLRNGVYLLQGAVPHTPAAQQVLGMMERQVQHLVRMVDDLLDVSRISRGKIDLRKGPLELASAVAQAVETCRPFLEARGHQLTVSLPAEPLRLEADPTRLAQVFGNLLNNSAKYTPEGGHVWVTAAREGDEAVVRVRDNGAGLPEELLPTKIFEPLTQAARPLARSEGGLGLGLTLVRKLVELHGGTVEAHSKGPGQGSEFVVRLPAAGRPLSVSSAQGARAMGDGPTRCRRILLVEDSRDVADSLALLLGVKGHEVRVARDGLEALDAARAFRPDAVLLDIGLPKLDGLQVARRLRQEPGLEGVLLVTLSGYGTQDDHRRSQEAGCDAHLVKPVDPEVLLGRFAAGR
jgi:PAS domain S-box-containing protein